MSRELLIEFRRSFQQLAKDAKTLDERRAFTRMVAAINRELSESAEKRAA